MLMLLLGPGLIGWCGDISGVALVLSSDEKRILFLPRNVSPMKWIPVEEFTVDPISLGSGSDLEKLRKKRDL
jgi:hypothetical protein